MPAARSDALIPPALATRVSEVPTGAEWLHEPKIDGYRLQCHVTRKRALLLSRTGIDYSARFPGVVAAAVALARGRKVVLDGEVVVPLVKGHSPFQSLQSALSSGVVTNATYWVFDILRTGTRDLRRLTLDERRASLVTFVGRTGRTSVIRMTPPLDGAPDTLLEAACARGEEGVISKRRDAPYRPGRSRDWVKTKCGERDELVIIGFTEPEGMRTHFGALLLASRAKVGDELRYAGRVGTGFDGASLADLHRQLLALQRDSPAVPVPRAVSRGVHWVEPRLVADVAFAEWTVDHLLRQATFQGIREDKEVGDVRQETSDQVAGVTISSGDRMVFPEIKLTKRALAEFYELASPLILQHMSGRPLSTMRCPDGAQKNCFYQKHWPAARGANVRTVRIAENDDRQEDYAVATDVSDVMALVQMNVIEFHMWGARTDALESPDRLILDLDPGPGISWSALREAAVHVRELLEAAGLQSWVKLSGGKGVHVTVPLERRTTWTQLSDLSRLMAGRLVADSPTTFVDTASKEKRKRRIFIDWMRNNRGATAVAPWTVRARRNAPVAVPVAWSALADIDSPSMFTVPAALELIASKPDDPWADMTTCRQRLTAKVIDALAEPAPATTTRTATRTRGAKKATKA
ncbi:MAG TPA: DNA ligase D [Gemmatimonadaceae bacterium]|nr:DNA ligase D [Gemmatimonadaceae bacterium]